jgi:hypothetical protein
MAARTCANDPETSTPRPPWRRGWPYAVLSLAVATILAVSFWLAPLPLGRPNKITRENFRKINLGMPQAELSELMGAPEVSSTGLGKVEGPETYTINPALSAAEQRARGFREYRFQQWTSSDILIVVITDAEGTVVCRYCGEGPKVHWFPVIRSWLPPWGSP